VLTLVAVWLGIPLYVVLSEGAPFLVAAVWMIGCAILARRSVLFCPRCGKPFSPVKIWRRSRECFYCGLRRNAPHNPDWKPGEP
jgi:hypothetical protein